jgi:transketolase
MLDFRDGAFDRVYDLMSQANDLVLLYNDMGAMGIDRLKQDFPERVINVGISEQNLISVAAGLALVGKRVFVYGIIAHVTGRCYEQIKVDICNMQQPVTILGIGSGLSYGPDGPTHHAIQDIALMRTLPGMHIYNPADAITASACVKLACENRAPAYIRMDKDQHQAIYAPDFDFSAGFQQVLPGKRVLLVSTGMMTHVALKVAAGLKTEGVDVGVLDLFRIKPVDSAALLAAVAGAEVVLTMEEHIAYGGIGSLLAELLFANGLRPKFKSLSLKEGAYLGATGRKGAAEQNGLTPEVISATVRALI